MGIFSPWRSPPASGPREVTIERGLSLEVTPREVDGRPCRTYRSVGLATRGQREISVHVALRAGEPSDALDDTFARLYRTFAQLASEGRTVGEGAITEVGAAGFLEPRLGGLLYTRTDADRPGELGAVVLLREELALVRASHPMRVLGRLGHAYRHFPFPRFSDRDRPAVVSPRDGESILGKTARIAVSDAWLLAHGEDHELRVGPEARTRLRGAFAELAPDAAFALVTAPDPRADAWLVWSPGQTEPTAITPPGGRGERVTAGFLLLVGEQPADETRLHEDGMAALLRPATLAAVREALVSGTSLDVEAPRGALRIRAA